jgi:urease accessory protein
MSASHPERDHATMADEADLYRLLAWSSPAYPTGSFSYSHGLEWAVESGSVTDRHRLVDYVTAVLSRGGAWVDAVLFVHAWRAARASAEPAACADPSPHASLQVRPAAMVDLDLVTELAGAFRGSAETALESHQQGIAFLDVTRKAWPHPTIEAFAQRVAGTATPVAHCIAVAVACAAHNIALIPALHAYLHAVAANLVSAGARLIPLGQTHAQISIARLAPTISEVAQRALSTRLDDLGTAAPAVELCSLRHETQYTRLFRS